MKKTGILLILVWFTVTLHAQYVTPWGISPLAVPVNEQSADTRISSLSLGGVYSTVDNHEMITMGLQQTGLDVYIPIWDTIDIEDLMEYSVKESSTVNFYLESGTLGPEAIFQIESDEHIGTCTWDEEHQLFTFTHDPAKVSFCDTVVFIAFTGTDTIRTEIAFTYLPSLPPEENAMGLNKVSAQEDGLMSDVMSVFDIADSTLHIAGRILLFNTESDDQGICDYSAAGEDGRYDSIKHVILYADSMVISESMWFQAADVTIYARKLVFDNPHASINTSPWSYPETVAEIAMPGGNAGNIYLKTGDIQMGPGIHFMLNGGMGESTTIDTIPGGVGGNGGVLESPVFVSEANYACLPGAPGINGKTSLEKSTWGDRGSLISTDWYPTIWIHARILQPEIAHLRMQYMENNLAYVGKKCASLDELLSEKFAGVDTVAHVDDADLMNVHNEIIEMQNRLRNRLDYFGNPVGWVPLLSFEIYKEAFEQEVDHAFNLMFLSYLINKADASIVQAKQGMTSARTEMINEVEELQDGLNENIGRLTTYEIQYDAAEAKADTLRQELEELEERLLKEAKENAEKAQKIAFIKSIADIGGQLISCIPYPGCAAVGGLISTAAKIDYEDPWTMDNVTTLASGVHDSYKAYKNVSTENLGDKDKIMDKTSIGDQETTDSKAGLSKWNGVSSTVKDMGAAAKDFDLSSLQLKASDEDVQAELDKLKAGSSEYKNAVAKVEAAIYEKQRLHNEIEITMNNISSALNRTAENRMSIQSLTASIQDSNGKRNLRAMQYANNLEKRSFERLKKYHYLMVRAYEYRTLNPWTEPLEMEDIKNGLFGYVESLHPDSSAVLPQEQLDIIKSIYLDQLHVIAAAIIDEIDSEGFTRNLSITFDLTKDEIEMLNKNHDLFINPFERNVFGLDRENIRIMDIGVVKCELEDGTMIEGELISSSHKSTSLDDTPIEIRFEHSGFSKLQSDGNIYYFNHNRVGRNQLKWTSIIDISGDKITQEGLSNSDKSLLHSLLDGLSDSELSFCSEPSAWANIELYRISGIETRNITSLKVEINYDFKYLDGEYKSLKVETDGEVSPYYLLSAPDITDLSDGKGSFFRTYRNFTPVVITAQKQFGQQKFVRWDKVPFGVGGRSEFSKTETIGLAMTEHTHLIAVYDCVDSVWIKTPLTDQTIEEGETMNITWDQNMDHDMKLDLYANGFFVRAICDSVMGKAYNWSIPLNLDLPETGNGLYQVKITSRLDNTIFDWSGNISLIQKTESAAGKLINESAMKVYPNPAEEVLWISFDASEVINEVNWTLYTLAGKAVDGGIIEFGVEQNSKPIELSGVPAGAYLLQVQANSKTYSREFIKK